MWRGWDVILIRGRDATLIVPLKEDISKPDKVKAHSFPKYIVRDTQIHWDYRQNQHHEPHPNQDGVVLLLVPMVFYLIFSWFQDLERLRGRSGFRTGQQAVWGRGQAVRGQDHRGLQQMPTEQPQACWGRGLSSLLITFTLWKTI